MARRTQRNSLEQLHADCGLDLDATIIGPQKSNSSFFCELQWLHRRDNRMFSGSYYRIKYSQTWERPHLEAIDTREHPLVEHTKPISSG